MATDGSGWIRKTYAALKTAMSFTKADVGLGNVDNTSDTNKPISTAQQTALNGKENISNKSTNTSLGTSDTLYPSQKAVKDYVDGKAPTTKGMWIDGVYKPNAFPASAKVTTSGGNAVVHFTNGGTSGGAAIFPNNIYLSTVQVNPYGTTNNLQPGNRTLSNSNKTLTVEVRQTLLALAVLSLTTSANGLDCVITIWGD